MADVSFAKRSAVKVTAKEAREIYRDILGAEEPVAVKLPANPLELCGCVVTVTRGHTHTKFCDTHLTTPREEEPMAETETSEVPGGPVPLDPKQLLKEERSVARAKKEPKKRAPRKEPKAKAAKVKEAKRQVKTPGDGLGREGTAGRFIRERLIAGDSNEKAVAAARKRFPDNKIADNYGAWYTNELVKAGLLKAAK